MPEAKSHIAARARENIAGRDRDARGRLLPLKLALENLPKKRSEALAAGSFYYFTGSKCPRGHLAWRWASSSDCSECIVARKGRRLADAQKRRRRTEVTYTNGRPCIRGHMARRYVSNGTCVECSKEHDRRYYAETKELRNARTRERYANDPEYRVRINGKKTPEQKERARQKRLEKWRNDPEYRKRQLEASRARRAKAASKRVTRDYDLKSLYGISLADYERLLAKQDGVCAICGDQSKKTLSVDHDHNTGTVRGLLCGMCNRGLGLFSDDADIVNKAVQYLESNSGN